MDSLRAQLRAEASTGICSLVVYDDILSIFIMCIYIYLSAGVCGALLRVRLYVRKGDLWR